MQKSNAGLRDVTLATLAEAKLPVITAVMLSQGGGAYARVEPKATAWVPRTAAHRTS